MALYCIEALYLASRNALPCLNLHAPGIFCWIRG